MCESLECWGTETAITFRNLMRYQFSLVENFGQGRSVRHAQGGRFASTKGAIL